MTKYENQNGLVTDDQVKAYVLDNDSQLTDNINEALYILRDGSMISGMYEYGIRGDDHRMIEGLISEGETMHQNDQATVDFWKALHQKTGLVRVVPETKQALIAKGQKLTANQKEAIDELNYQVQEYI